MSNKEYRYALSKDKKVAGVFAHLSERSGIDATLMRLAYVAGFLFIDWEPMLIGYIAMALFLTFRRKQEVDGSLPRQQGDQPEWRQPRGSVHDLRTKLDDTDRRLMAIDHHLNAAENDALAREIEALKEDK